MSQTDKPSDLKWVLEDLVIRVPEVKDAILLSEDGLLISASAGLSRVDADHLAAVASGYQSLSRGAGRLIESGPVRQTIVEMESAFLFITAAGERACLAVVSAAESDIGLIAYEMAVLVQRVGAALSTSHRAGPPRPNTVRGAP